MPYIEVPAFKQPRDSVLCGPTCARMILAYYGIKMPLNKIVKEIRIVKTGTDLADLGQFFMAHGFKTEIKFWLPGLEPRWFGSNDPAELKNILQSKVRGPIKRTWNHYRSRLLKYVNSGGSLTLSPIMPSIISEEIMLKRPLIISINNRVMDATGKGNRGHFIVPIGVTDDDSQVSQPMITYRDPSDGRSYIRYMEEIAYYNSIWEGGALLIKPQESS